MGQHGENGGLLLADDLISTDLIELSLLYCIVLENFTSQEVHEGAIVVWLGHV